MLSVALVVEVDVPTLLSYIPKVSLGDQKRETRFSQSSHIGRRHNHYPPWSRFVHAISVGEVRRC
jgi:hypothetical protein